VPSENLVSYPHFTTVCAVTKLRIVPSFYDSLCRQKTWCRTLILRQFVLSENFVSYPHFTTVCAVRKLGVVPSFYDTLCCQKTSYRTLILRQFMLSENLVSYPHFTTVYALRALSILLHFTPVYAVTDLHHSCFISSSPGYYAPTAFTSREDLWYSFMLEAESTSGPECGRKDLVNDKSPNPIENLNGH
jgi:hypothetical protein